VIALDTNILVYAHREDSPFHETAFRRVAELAEGPAVWAIPWPCVHEFLAIVTHPRIYAPPTPLDRRGRCLARIADAGAVGRVGDVLADIACAARRRSHCGGAGP
jgi:uncharacterized protein